MVFLSGSESNKVFISFVIKSVRNISYDFFVKRVMVFIQLNQILASSSSQLTTNIHWSCYCYIHVLFMLSYIFEIVCGIFEWTGSKSVQVFFIICLNMYCCWRSSYKKGRVGIPLTGSVPSQGPVLPTSHMVFCVQQIQLRLRGGCSFCWNWMTISFNFFHING